MVAFKIAGTVGCKRVDILARADQAGHSLDVGGIRMALPAEVECRLVIGVPIDLAVKTVKQMRESVEGVAA